MRTRQRKISGRFVVFVFLFPVLSLGLLYSGNRWLLWGLLMWTSVGLLTLVWHVGMTLFLRLESSVDYSKPVKGQVLHMILVIRNRSPFPIFWGQLHLITIDSLFRDTVPVHVFSLLPFSRQSIRIEMNCPHRGVFPVGVDSLIRRDPFGFLSLPARNGRGARQSIRVWPRAVRVPDIVKNITVLEDKTSARQNFSEDLSSVHHIRDWRDGDTAKKIHWKLTARTGSLMVKEFDGMAREEIVIFLDTSTRFNDPAETADRIRYEDALIEAAFSIISTLLRDGRPLRLSTHRDIDTHMHGTSVDDIDRFYNYLAFVAPEDAPGMLDLMLNDMALLPGGGSLIVIGDMPDAAGSSRLKRLATDGLDVIYVIACADRDRILAQREKIDSLRNAGVACLLADPDNGLSQIGERGAGG